MDVKICIWRMYIIELLSEMVYVRREFVFTRTPGSLRVIGQNVLMANPSHQTFYPHYVSRSKQLHHPRLKDSFPIDSSHSFADK